MLKLKYLDYAPIPLLRRRTKKRYKPCEKCGEEIEYEKSFKRFCFDCNQKRKAEYNQKRRVEYNQKKRMKYKKNFQKKLKLAILKKV